MVKYLTKKETRLLENRTRMLSAIPKRLTSTEDELMRIAREIKRKNRWIFEELKKY